ncbi:hypothetical protein JCM8097_005293 [Rhodosporidiobolus ruineniae]
MLDWLLRAFIEPLKASLNRLAHSPSTAPDLQPLIIFALSLVCLGAAMIQGLSDAGSRRERTDGAVFYAMVCAALWASLALLHLIFAIVMVILRGFSIACGLFSPSIDEHLRRHQYATGTLDELYLHHCRLSNLLLRTFLPLSSLKSPFTSHDPEVLALTLLGIRFTPLLCSAHPPGEWAEMRERVSPDSAPILRKLVAAASRYLSEQPSATAQEDERAVKRLTAVLDEGSSRFRAVEAEERAHEAILDAVLAWKARTEGILGGFVLLVPDESKAHIGVVALGIYLHCIAYSPGEGPVPFTYSAEAPTGAFGWYAAWNFIGAALSSSSPRPRALEELDAVFSVPTFVHSKYQSKAAVRAFRKYILRQNVAPMPSLYGWDEKAVESAARA